MKWFIPILSPKEENVNHSLISRQWFADYYDKTFD